MKKFIAAIKLAQIIKGSTLGSMNTWDFINGSTLFLQKIHSTSASLYNKYREYQNNETNVLCKKNQRTRQMT